MESFKLKYDILNTISESQESTVYLTRNKDTDVLYLLKSLKQKFHRLQ